MTRAELVKRLRDTAETMKWTGDALDFYGGSWEASGHAFELIGAAEMVMQWADELAKEVEE